MHSSFKNTSLVKIFGVVCCLALGCAREVQVEPAASSFYTVDHYDESHDPTLDLTRTIKRAQAEEKRILLQVGGEWCGWCHRISRYMEENAAIRALLDKSYLVMKVTYPSDHSTSFLADYPAIEGYPHLFVLESDGTFLHSQGTGELEEGESYNQDVFANFLKAWAE